VQRDWDKEIYIPVKTAALDCGISQKPKNPVQFGPALFEIQYHFSEGISVKAASSYLVEMDIVAHAIGAGTFKYRIFACILSASRAVVGTCTANKFIPAVSAQVIVGFRNVFAAVYTDCGPKEMIYSVEGKNNGLFYFPRIHIGNYTNSYDADKIR